MNDGAANRRLPTDLVLTKRFADRPKDLEDIRLLRSLAERRS